MGGLDLFVSRKDSTGNWGTLVNLGYPINTWRDESDLRVNARGTMAIISSNRDGGYGGSDLYQFELYPGARPQAVSYVKGVISDAKSGKKLQAAFELTDVSSGDIVVQSLSNELSGQFIVTLPPDREYALNVSKQGYLFYSEHFDLKNTRDTLAPTMLNIRLQPIEPGNTVVLKNVFFDSNSFTLKPESKVELTLLVEFMLANPTVGIELSGHTDNTGDQKKNIVLSEQRSKAVKTFMMLGGIAEKRLSCKGYGDTRPLEANDSEEHKAKNRRTEFMVVEK
jgi:outer membrane protein OmpA-like peptidoglycan-associated protein